MLGEGFQDSVEGVLGGVGDDLASEDFEEERELIHTNQELNGDGDERAHIEFLKELGHLDEVGELLLKELDGQDLGVLAEIVVVASLTVVDPQVEPVHFEVEGDQELHRSLVLLLGLQALADLLPVLILVDPEVPLCQEVHLGTIVVVGETLGIGDDGDFAQQL